MEAMQSVVGRTEKQAEGYLAFMPATLPPDLPTMSASTVAWLANASEALGRLSAAGLQLPNRDLFIGMYVRKEALLSSRIEGIECTLDEVLRFEDEPGSSEVKDVSEVVNYVRALNLGCERLENGGTIDLALIRELHAVLMPGSRGGDSPPGQFRNEQNWIGHKGSSALDARYVPPPVERMRMTLANLAYYVSEFQGHAPIVRCAIAHAQFETIHPFHDGNGRLGRLLMPLILKREGVLAAPILYLSLFLLANRLEYFDRLTALRRGGDWNAWIEFFCHAVKYAADDALGLSHAIAALRDEVEGRVGKLPASTRRLASRLFEKPLLDTRSAQALIGTTFDTAADSLRRLESIGVLVEITRQRRNKRYRFSRYLDLLERRV